MGQRQAKVLMVILQRLQEEDRVTASSLKLKVCWRRLKIIWMTATESCWVGSKPHTGTISAQRLSNCCLDTSSEEDCGEPWTTSDLSRSLLVDGVWVDFCQLEHRRDPCYTLSIGSSCAPSLPLLDRILFSPLSSTFTGYSVFLNVALYRFHWCSTTPLKHPQNLCSTSIQVTFRLILHRSTLQKSSNHFPKSEKLLKLTVLQVTDRAPRACMFDAQWCISYACGVYTHISISGSYWLSGWMTLLLKTY